MIRFTSPEVLAALLLLPLVPLALRGRGRRPLVALRLAATMLLVVSAAGLQITRAMPDLTVVVAADRSDSLGPDGDRLIRAFLDDLRTSAHAARRIGLVSFGAEAVLEETPSAQPRLALAARPRSDGTDIAAAITSALSALPEGAGRRIVLLTDGQATTGDLAPALAEVRRRGVELVVVPAAADPPADVLVEEVQAPQTAAVGERLPVTVVLRATAPAQAALRVRANGTLLVARDLELRAGRTRVDLEPLATQPGLLRLDAIVDATPDGEPGNNRGFALTYVTGPPFVYYVGPSDGPLAAALEAQGLRVRRVAPAGLPASVAAYQGAAAVVLDDVPAYLLNARQQVAIRDFVRGGGGLVAVGGTRSFGIGGYADTPIEEALPVSMDVRHRLAVPTMAMILVLDASGSMGSFGTELAKVELAKETAQSVIDLLGERDLIGVIAFDQAPRWLVRPTPAAERARILEAVSRIQAGGGTNLYPALEAARNALRQVEARIKHVIVLSDGQTDPGAFQRLVRGMAAERMTVSTVAIGRDADLEIMRNIAAWGQGRSYETRDLYSIPQIFAAEALLATRAYVIEERFEPRRSGTPAVLGDLGAIPALRGYLATAPKPAAEVALLSHQDDPVMAVWSYGLGRAVAITTDARGRWTAEWAGWSEAARFWSQAVRWAASREADAIDAHAELVPGGVRVVVDARDADGTPLMAWEVAASLVGDGGEAAAASLVQTRPGWYEAMLPMPAPGAYLVRVAAADARGPVGRAAVPLAVPYSAELKQVGLNRAVLSYLVEVGGARVVTTPREALAPPANPARRSQPAWPLAATLALIGFTAEVALRRIPAIEYHAGRLAAAAAAFVRRAPPPAQAAEDAEYAAADRWRIDDAAEAAARAASMEAAARLYIARLRRQHGEGPADAPPPDG
ncbi:MAG: VWA domain-containing protein [Armatimonadota bacterium]|nr:VWA domain-containing protein [Armatimonadota bacterium]